MIVPVALVTRDVLAGGVLQLGMQADGQALVTRALRWAHSAHEGQWRDGDVPLPYLHHPLEVLHNLVVIGRVQDEEMMGVALLHDVVESSGADLGELELEFGPRIARLVQELTRTEPADEALRDLSADDRWQLRADMLLEDIRRMSPDAMAVKLADRLSNLREALTVKKGKKLARYLRQTRRILEVIPNSTNPRLWEEVNSMLRRAEKEFAG